MSQKTVPSSPSKSAILLRDTYQLYAKMLAVENIRVVFDEAIKAPAMFDLINRILYISPLHAAQAELVPGLVIHEVGHALFSILSEADSKRIKKISKLLNIIDDGYQERMMCKKYPNCKKQLFKVFDHFFLKTDESAYNDPNKLITIVNILNFNCKGFKHGHYKDYPSYVLPEDIDLLKQGESINVHSLMDRDAFAKKLAVALKKYGTADLDGDDISPNKGEKEEGSGEEKEVGEASDEEGDESDIKIKSNGAAGSYGEGQDPVEEELAKNEAKLNDHHRKFDQKINGATCYELPTFKDLLKLADVLDIANRDDMNYRLLADSLPELQNKGVVDAWRKNQKEAKKIAARIFTKFNMRVQAQNMANVQYKQSGVLDPERAALYQVYDDVFMKNAVASDQVNHAYSIVLDWSGSMGSSIGPLMFRIMELVYFAKSTNIEVEVWLYTTGYGPKGAVNLDRNVAMNRSKFIHILNTKRHGTLEVDHRLMLFYLKATGFHSTVTGGPGIHEYFNKFGLDGTNILEGLILGHAALSVMQAERKTCFMLSDGGDVSGFDGLYEVDGKSPKRGQNPKIILNGLDVDTLKNTGSTRGNATASFAELMLAIGQKTTGVAWNISANTLKSYCQSVVEMSSARSKSSIDGYVHADNKFIDEMVKNLL